MKVNAKVMFCEQKTYETNTYFKLTLIVEGVQGFVEISSPVPYKQNEVVHLVPYVNAKHKLVFGLEQ